MNPRFKILYHDAGHIVFESETRQEWAHVINYTKKDGSDMECSCEFSHEGGNDDCKHRKYFREILCVKPEMEAEQYV